MTKALEASAEEMERALGNSDLKIIVRCSRALHERVVELEGALVALDKKRLQEHARAATAEATLARYREALTREARSLELLAAAMRNPERTGGWEGAERVAAAFERACERLRALLPSPAAEKEGSRG